LKFNVSTFFSLNLLEKHFKRGISRKKAKEKRMEKWLACIFKISFKRNLLRKEKLSTPLQGERGFELDKDEKKIDVRISSGVFTLP